LADVHALAIVLAGGQGNRLHPLTADRAKPAVPFGGNYRLIDFALSNLVNAGFLQIVVLTQYKSHSLDRHIAQTWRLSSMLGNYVASVPAQMRRGTRWFQGSADAIYQNFNLLLDENPDYVLVFGADHVCRMDPRQMLESHIASGAGVTVAGIRSPLEEASSFGVIDAGNDRRILAFREKPNDAVGLPDSPNEVLASMGNYIFTTRVLMESVTTDAAVDSSQHDMGGNIVPMLVERGEAAAYDFNSNEVPGVNERERGYWRDVGTLDAYYDASLDLVSPQPSFNLYNREWPIYSGQAPLPPAKFVSDHAGRPGEAIDSLVSAGVIISGGTVRRSILSPAVFIHPGALVEGSVLFDGVDIGEGAVVRNAILDKNVHVEPGARIGVDPDEDRQRFTISPGGTVVVAKNATVQA
jgi:glucose-1-phosphate adenylyltransferase